MQLSLLQRFAVIPVLLAGVGGGVSLITWRALDATTTSLTSAHRVEALAIEARYHVSAMSDALKSVVLDPSNRAEAARKAAADENYDRTLETLASLTTDAEVLAGVKAVGDFDHTHLHPNEERAMQLIDAGKVAEAQALLNQTYIPLLGEFNGRVDALHASAERLVARETAAVEAGIDTSMERIIFSLLVGLGLVAALLMHFAVGFGRRIRGLNDALSDTAGDVASASREFTTAGGEVAQAATEGAACVQDVAAAIEEVTSMTQANAENSRKASALATESSRGAERGEAEISRLLTAMGEISTSSRRIQEITSVIDDIAFQTNLLALNAAVEAARAGEQGAGFAVVADAVRSLAGRSASAAKDISDLIRECVERIDHGRTIADASGRVLKDIVESTRQTAELNQHIAAASADQSIGIQQISASINQLDAAGHQNAAVAEEMAASAQSLAEQVDAMHMVVDRLRGLVEGEPGGGFDDAYAPQQRVTREDTEDRSRLQQALPLPASRGAKVQRVGGGAQRGGARGQTRRSASQMHGGRSRLAPQTTIH